MAKFSFSVLLVLLVIIIPIAAAIKPGPPGPPEIRKARSRAFIEEQCRGTHYYRLCVRYLTIFARSFPSETQTPEQLARLALRVSLVRARLTSEYITRVAKDLKQRNQALSDCLQQINDGVDQLRNSVRELGKMSLASQNDFFWHKNNINSWLSTAQTEALTCLDGFSGHAMGSRLKATIRAKVQNVAEATSNALAFFNRYVARHRASRSQINP